MDDSSSLETIANLLDENSAVRLADCHDGTKQEETQDDGETCYYLEQLPISSLCVPAWEYETREGRLKVDQDTLSLSSSHQEYANETNNETNNSSNNPHLTPLERFSDDIAALILSHLNLQEISNTSLTSKRLYKACRSNSLWKELMTCRWNVAQQEHLDHYFTAYQQAHAHPHDLWISHWNCVFPYESLAPGRCCIASPQSRSSGQSRHGGSNHCCPRCRNWNEFEKEKCSSRCEKTAATPAQLMATATCYTRQRLDVAQRKDYTTDCVPSQYAQRQAFQCAGTMHRTLRVRQYNHEEAGGPSNFLTDLLFFNLTDPFTEEGQWELKQLLQEAQEEEESVIHANNNNGNEHHHDDYAPPNPLFETSHHSWHVVRLFNPDFYRPILYQMGVQRPDCFTVYPSEGYIEPGGAMFLTIGVRPLGSALAYAFDALNVQRDGLFVEWADLYTDQAHLPLAPILIRYQFASVAPSCPLHDPRQKKRSEQQAAKEHAEREAVLEYYWRQQPPAPHHVRSIHLSAHVHSLYHFNDFLRATCHPWGKKATVHGPIYVAPVLRERFPRIYAQLQDGGESALDETEGPCGTCGTSWGIRQEELAQAYWLWQAESQAHVQRRKVLLENLALFLRVLLLGRGVLGSNPSVLSTLLVTITQTLQFLKGSPWTSLLQKRIALQWEAVVDDLYRQDVPVGGEDWVPWRLAGVYRYAVCTDSVFQGPRLEDDSIDADFKGEPDYLDAFRHLAHSPGQYCLGPQEDPNHLEETVVLTSRRYARTQKGIATDVFMDDPISAFQAGICMMRDARSLLVHGIYDRINYPGSVVRRPKLRPFVRAPLAWKAIGGAFLGKRDELQHLLEGRRKFLILQCGLDVIAIQAAEGTLSDDWSAGSHLEGFPLENYLRGIPPPGVGKFALSQESTIDPSDNSNETKPRIVRLKLENELEISDSSSSTTDGPVTIDREFRPNRAPVGENARGPRILHLLWVLGAQMGLAVIDSPTVASVFVDRSILIASQWVSISLMAAPLFWTLCARYAQLIPAQPVDYNLEDLPFSIPNKMRFLTDRECGYVAVLVFFVWLALGRWSERHISRDFFRVMLEHISPGHGEEPSRLKRIANRISLWWLRQWDFICPLFLQRRVFAPQWNRRSTDDLMKHIAFWRSRDFNRLFVARPVSRRDDCLFGDSRDEGLIIGNIGPMTKLVVGALVATGSFCSTSPHFWLNLVTVFSCSISLGMSVSLHSMEKGASSVNMSSTGSMIKAASLATVVILAFLVGQLVGSSGGTMFLAEFIVTSISLVLGGAGTISASAMESWGCFFCLSSTAFWGYLFGRVALMDGIRQKRGGYSSILLSKAVIFLFFFWVLVFMITRFDGPVSLVILRPYASKDTRTLSDRVVSKLLQ